jgi:hypothetical protein
MHRPALPLVLALLMAGCAGRTNDWPSLNPRPGEISPMVPRNVPGVGRCRGAGGAECAPPAEAVVPAAPDMPAPTPPLSFAAAETELAALEALVAQVEAAAAPARAARDTARTAAAGSAVDTAVALQLEAAESALGAALAPLAGADYRRAALAEALRDAPAAAATLASRLDALANRIAALQAQ